MATGALPMPRSNDTFVLVEPPPLPVPPPVRPATPPTTPPANPNAAPVVPPDGIAKSRTSPFEEPAAVDGGVDPILGDVVIGDQRDRAAAAAAARQAAGACAVGGDIRQPERSATSRRSIRRSRRRPASTGIVIIEAIIGTDGRVQGARVLRSVAAARRGRARGRACSGPTRRHSLNGVPVAVIMTVTVHFQLQQRGSPVRLGIGSASATSRR